MVTIDTPNMAIGKWSKTEVLPTYSAVLVGDSERKTRVIGLLDSRSQKSFIRERTAKEAGDQEIRKEHLSVIVFGKGNEAKEDNAVFRVKIGGTQCVR